jgi:hypothetical protein
MIQAEFFSVGKRRTLVDPTEGVDPHRAHVLNDADEAYSVNRAPSFQLEGLVSPALLWWLNYYGLDYALPVVPGAPRSSGDQGDQGDDTEIEPEDFFGPEVRGFGEVLPCDEACPPDLPED